MTSLVKCATLVLLLTSWSPSPVLGGRWILSFKTANTWMAGYVGDITACFHFVPVPLEVSNVTIEDTVKENIKNDYDNNDGDDEKLEDCHAIPWRSFERGKSYMFGLDFIKDTELEKVRLYAKPENSSLCKRKHLDAWHVEEVTFQNLLSGQLFEKYKLPITGTTKNLPSNKNLVKNYDKPTNKQTSSLTIGVANPNVMLIGPKCGNNNDLKELVLEDFNVSIQPRPCEFSDGLIYKDGESFEDGCSAYCKCRDGAVSCVSRCPPSIALGCREVYSPGECCPTFICDSAETQLTCPLYEENDCETANRTVTPGEYPWAAFIKLCDVKKGCNRYCSGALLNEQWLLSASECIMWPNGKQATVDQIRVIVGEHTLVLAEDRDVEIGVERTVVSPGKPGTLALIKLKERVVFDRAVQPAIIPHTKEHCQQLLQPYCGLSVTGWTNIDSSSSSSSPSSVTEQYDLYRLNTRLEEPHLCPVSLPDTTTVPSSRRRKPPPPSRHRDATLCINLGNNEPELSIDCGTCHPEDDSAYTCTSDKNTYICSGEKGRTMVSRVQVPTPYGDLIEVNILVGVITYNHNDTDATDSICKNSAYRLGVGICHDFNWITNTISSV